MCLFPRSPALTPAPHCPQIFTLPAMRLVFRFTHAAEGPSTMREGGSCRSSSSGSAADALHVKEVALHSFGTSVKSGGAVLRMLVLPRWGLSQVRWAES